MGEPGGDGGISRFGTGGRVRLWIIFRASEYGEDGPDAEGCADADGDLSGLNGPTCGSCGSNGPSFGADGLDSVPASTLAVSFFESVTFASST